MSAKVASNGAYNGTQTQCTVTAPYTGVGGGGTISIVLAYPGNGKSPFLANSISAGSSLVRRFISTATYFRDTAPRGRGSERGEKYEPRPQPSGQLPAVNFRNRKGSVTGSPVALPSKV